MSWEVFVSVFENGNSAALEREAVQRAVAGGEGDELVEIGGHRWRVKLEGAPAAGFEITAHAVDEGGEKIRSLVFHRPPNAGEALWTVLHRLLMLGPVVVYSPGRTAPIVGSEETIPHLPPGMAHAMGEPVVALTAEEIRLAVREAPEEN